MGGEAVTVKGESGEGQRKDAEKGSAGKEALASESRREGARTREA